MTSVPRNLAVHVDSRDALDVRHFAVEQRISSLFRVTITAVSESAEIDFDAVVGRPASFRMDGGLPADAPVRVWTGVCERIAQVGVDEAGLSTYEITLVPALWLATQRRNHRIFQQMSELDVARKILGEWGIDPDLRIAGAYRKREYRVQYGESDYAFVCRMLEEAGVSFFFEVGDAETRMVLSDAPQAGAPRRALPFRDSPTVAPQREHVTKVRVGRQVRPGRYTVRDHDPRLSPSYPLVAGAAAGDGVEARLERYDYVPGAFSFDTDQGEDLPVGDDRGKTRSVESEAGALAGKRLEAERSGAKECSFETNVADLAPGVVTSVVDHPRSDVAGAPLLVTASSMSGHVNGEWTHRVEARRADAPYRPALSTPKPRISGVESATVVGPAGEEIHTDELGRVRVHFHWDRESRMDQKSSCWIHVSQTWSGAGYGGTNLPRVGQEVLVDFLGGDPDRPIITGRVYTSLQKTPYKLPDHKTQSAWKSSSSPHTGGYNEIMFEDAAGRELVRMQAEKDLHKLVKHDEQVTIGRDRTKRVGRDDAITVGNDRTKVVENDENVTIGNDRTKLVQGNERHVVGASRTRTVGVNESVAIGVDHTLSVGSDQGIEIGSDQSLSVGADQSVDVGGDHTTDVAGDHATTVGGDHSTEVGGDQTVDVAGAHALTVALASAETVGAMKALTVGAAYEVTVGADMRTTVAASQSESVATTKTVKAGDKIEIVCGKAKLTMEASGRIVWEIEGGASIELAGKDVLVTAGGGGVVVVKGGPNVHINP